MVARGEFIPFLRAFGQAIAVHVLVVLLMVLGTMNWKPFRQPQPVGMTIEAVIVDTSELRKQREEAQRAAAQAEQRKQAQERRAEELEQQRQREHEQEVQKQKDLEIQRQQALEAQKKKEAQDKLAALRLERERKLEEERVKQQRELEKVREQAEAAERQRQQEAERLKQLEQRKATEAAEQRRKLEEAERQKKEAAAAAQQAAQAGRIAGLEDEYEAAIRSLVTQNWLRPPTAQTGLRCTLKIIQIPGGEVISAAISGSCNGDEATRRSIIAAVERAGALPYRGFEDVFKREIDFIFIYDGD
jgi:colicin import membrane protein